MRRWISTAVAFAVFAMPSAAQAAPEGIVYEEHYLASADGTPLHADVWRPVAGGRKPVVMQVTPYNHHGLPAGLYSSKGPAQQEPTPPRGVAAAYALERKWVVALVSLRGFGGSGGCGDYGGPGEQSDVKAAVEWAADQSWSNGRVALAGGSYDGWTGIMGLATHPRGLAAVAVQAPVTTLYDTAYDDGVLAYSGALAAAIYPGAWANNPPDVTDPAYTGQWILRAPQKGCGLQASLSSLQDDRDTAFWRERDLRARAAASRVPIYVNQGFLDPQVPPEEILGLYRQLNGGHLHLEQNAHEPFVGPDLRERIRRFLARHLAEEAPAVRDPEVLVQEAPAMRWRTERRWPPSDAVTVTMPVLSGIYRDVRGNVAGDDLYYQGLTIPFATASPAASGRGTWSFTPPLETEHHVAGSGAVALRADGPPQARVIALLYDVAPDGTALLIARGASLVRNGRVEIALAHQDWRVAAGHRIGLLLTGSDDSWYPPTDPGTGAAVQARDAQLRLPVLRSLRDDFVEGPRGARFDAVKKPIRIDRQTIAERTAWPE